LLCDVTILVDGRPAEEQLQGLVDEVLALADNGVTGKLSWQALVDLPAIRWGRFGNAPLDKAENRQRAVQQFDANRDGQPDRDEILRLLTRQNRSRGLIDLQSNDASAGGNSATTATWQLLDADHDLKLSAEELSSAGQRLLNQDPSDEELLTLPKISTSTSASGSPQPESEGVRMTMAVVLDDATNWEHVWRMIGASYPGWRHANSIGGKRTARLLEPLDQNKNGRLTAEELARLRDVTPHLRITARLGQAAADEMASPLDLQADVSPDRWSTIEMNATARTASLTAQGLIVDWTLADQAADDSDPASTVATQLKKLDKDANGSLDSAEFSAADDVEESFEQLDLNDDGQIDEEEYRTVLSRERLVHSAAVRMDVVRAGDTVFATLDANHDGTLGAREMATAGQRLAACDANQDGRISTDEIPDRIIVQLTQGGGDGASGATAASRGLVMSRTGPAWFRRMDHNGDGDLSPREFLGTPARFAQLDTDHDGFISATEAAQAMSD